MSSRTNSHAHTTSNSVVDDLPPLTANGMVPSTVPIGTVIDRWDCPCCDRVVEHVHRPGRPRVYCSPACRQRAYRWRKEHAARTRSTPSWPAEAAFVPGGKRHHALRSDRDPLSRRRDRRNREVTVCGALARPHTRARARQQTVPFRHDDGPLTCRTCEALTRARPLGLVPAVDPQVAADAGTFASTVRALRRIHPDYPLDPTIRHLLATAWADAA